MNKFLVVIPPLLSIVYLTCFRSDAPNYSPSSVWCVQDLSLNRLCHMRYVTFNHSTLSFNIILKTESIISGLVSSKDLQKIQLSSVKHHNRFFANFSVFHSMNTSCSKKVEEPVVAIARFKPDNLMHVLHDDLLPLFVTLENICKGSLDTCNKQFSLMLLDDNVEGPYVFLYKLFTNNLLRSDIDCLSIKDLHIGLKLETIWYQYGFNSARGGINATFLSVDTLLRFQRFILSKLAISTSTEDHELKVVILKRQLTRKILNIENMVKLVKFVYGKNVLCKIMDVNINNTVNLIKEIVDTKLLIGMHGAEVILSIFLPADATVIEIMPSGIPSSVSYLEPLKNVSHFHYIQWKNPVRHSVGHPEYPAHLGGLQNLPPSEQNRIKNVESISEVRCCDDPVFLYLIYHDTLISNTFLEALVLSNSSQKSRHKLNVWFYPAAVEKLGCKFNSGEVIVSWLPPNNLIGDVKYSVTLQLGADSPVAVVLRENLLSIKYVGSAALVWVSAAYLTSGNSGPDSFTSCSATS